MDIFFALSLVAAVIGIFLAVVFPSRFAVFWYVTGAGHALLGAHLVMKLWPSLLG